MNINNITSEDWKNLAAHLLWCHCVEHQNEYSGYDIVINPGQNNIYSSIDNPYPRGNKPGDIVRDTTFLSYSIGPTRRLSWKELTLALGLYKDILLPDYHDCSRCEDYKNCKAYFKDDPEQERCSGWEKYHADEVPDIEEEHKTFIHNLLNNIGKLNLNLIKEVYSKTLGYELDSMSINENGTITHRHSDKFLDEHPERKDSPEFTEEEEQEQLDFISKIAFEDFKKYGSLFK